MKIEKPIHDLYSHSYISLKNKYFFHSVGKAANSTVKHFLYLGEARGTRFKYENVHDRRLSPLISPFQLTEEHLMEVFNSEDFFKFTFVRNPYSRLLSCYLDRIVPMRSTPYKELVRYLGKDVGYDVGFQEFIETICNQSIYEQNNHWRVQYYDAMCDIVDYSFIGKQERFSEDMTVIWKKIYSKFSVPNFESTNSSPSRTNSTGKVDIYWNSDLIKIVNSKYKLDFEYFKYEMM